MRRPILALAIAATLYGVVAAPAAAAPKPRPKTPAGVTVTVTVMNWRQTDLVELQAAESGSADWKKVLGALKAGEWTSAKIPQSKNCHVDLRGKYADGESADVSNVDICADKTINLTN
jgi:hypothetical protein